jgi:hypothetical protein
LRLEPWLAATFLLGAGVMDVACGGPDCKRTFGYTLDEVAAICDGDHLYCDQAVPPQHCAGMSSASCLQTDCPSPSPETLAGCLRKTCPGAGLPNTFNGKYTRDGVVVCEYVNTEYCL